ncbi:MAG: amidohydrolase family protein [Acidobacteriota bacterium]|nr:amidohydrolase family protein [Acidobacteriota bacterium]
MRIARCLLIMCLGAASPGLGQQPPLLAPVVQKHVRVNSPRVVLEHVRVIDGTGKPAVDDQNVIIEKGRIAAVQPGADVAQSSGTVVLDLRGYSVMPGIIGMHDHLYYIARPDRDAAGPGEPPVLVPQMTFSSPRLYLGAGVTTLRTTGSVETYADLNLKRDIEAGSLPGPHLDVTGPYLEGPNSYFIQMHALTGPDDARRMVNYWADQGVTSFKAYMNITRDELKAAIEEAHKRGIKITGHLCSVTYKEAAELGIDDLEHGFYVNTQLDPDKKPDLCPPTAGGPTLEKMAPDSPEAKDLIATLVKDHVAVTSTLPVFENSVPGRPPLSPRMMDALTSEARDAYLYARNARLAAPAGKSLEMFKRDMQLEKAFSDAGGLLLAGPDPTGNGGTLPGFGDQREIELLVEAGFTPVQAIQVATLNGATYMGKQNQIGSIAVGKNADLVVLKGNPASRIEDIENVEIVFKDGVGFDSQKLIESVRGRYGEY